MRTKTIAPWGLKTGQSLVMGELSFPILEVIKKRSSFTGKNYWHVIFDEFGVNSFVNFHAKFRNLPLEKAKIRID